MCACHQSKRARVVAMKGTFCLFLAAALISTASAADYYVAPSGHDSNPGSFDQPWKTVQKAANTLRPGDTAYVRAGTYSKVMVNVSGSSAEGRVKFANYPGEKPVIAGNGIPPDAGDSALFFLHNRQYVTIEGFELRDYKTNSTSATLAGIFLTGACQHIQIRDCDIHDIWNTGGTPDNSGNAFGIAVYGTSKTPASNIVIDGNDVHHLRTGASESVVLNGNVTAFKVTNNRVHDNNNIGIDFIGFEGVCPDPAQDQARDGVCRGNKVWNISSDGNQAYPSSSYGADGIYCDGATRVVIERNIVHHSDIGVELASERPGAVTSAITLRNNLIYLNRQTGLYLGGYKRSGTGGTDRCTITGNTFFKNDTLQWQIGQAQLRFRTSNCVISGNIFHSGPRKWLFSMPVSSVHNVNNRLDYNLYYSGAGRQSSLWSWNNQTQTGFAAWRRASGQDLTGQFADPRFVETSTSPDLHLGSDSPAIDAGDPLFKPAAAEKDIDRQPRINGSRIDIGADETGS